MEIVDWIKIFIICYVLRDMAHFIADLIWEYTKIKNKPLKLVLLLLTYVLSCGKCFSMWLALILGCDLFFATGIALGIGLIEQAENKKTKLL